MRIDFLIISNFYLVGILGEPNSLTIVASNKILKMSNYVLNLSIFFSQNENQEFVVHERWVTRLNGCCQLNLSQTLLKLMAVVLAKVEVKLFLHTTWSNDQWVTWLGGWDTLTVYRKNICIIAKIYVCITNWGKLVLQIGAAPLLQIETSVVTN